eukprot:1158414-Pelagomonas_calceolata.AAC.2
MFGPCGVHACPAQNTAGTSKLRALGEDRGKTLSQNLRCPAAHPVQNAAGTSKTCATGKFLGGPAWSEQDTEQQQEKSGEASRCSSPTDEPSVKVQA